jgi:hypothetical protein
MRTRRETGVQSHGAHAQATLQHIAARQTAKGFYSAVSDVSFLVLV